tara:strand:+ start:407 stop:925 length:519 start_codon:yes stop_codon:yes gene_type:complete
MLIYSTSLKTLSFLIFAQLFLLPSANSKEQNEKVGLRAVNMFGLTVNTSSRSETLEIWGNRIKNTTGASSNQFIKKVEYKLSEMRIDGGATQVTCFKYKSFLNGRREQKDCFFFQQEILVGMRLLLSQYKCWQKCELLKNATSRAISQGFEHYDFSEKNGSLTWSTKIDQPS